VARSLAGAPLFVVVDSYSTDRLGQEYRARNRARTGGVNPAELGFRCRRSQLCTVWGNIPLVTRLSPELLSKGPIINQSPPLSFL
jgi:hypothetical protein